MVSIVPTLQEKDQVRMLPPTIGQTDESILDLCCSVAGNRTIVAACLYGPAVRGYGSDESNIDVLLILKGFGSRIKTYGKKISGRNALVLAVDQSAFQRDVSAGWLGEIAADKLLIPYEPAINSDYLWRQEVALKKRVAWELLEGLILEFPELSHELTVKQEYFMYEDQMKRARLFPLVAYRFLNMLQNDVKQENVETTMKGYRKALEELSDEKWITLSSDCVKVTPKLVNAIRKKIRIPIFLRAVQRTTLLHVFSTLPRMLAPLTVEATLYARAHPNQKETEDASKILEDPRKHVFMSTPFGSIPLSDATDIEEFAKKTISGLTTVGVETKEIGGVLNSIYLLTLRTDHEQQKIVVKKFRDWAGFKWFPLALWALGTKSFAVLGKSRLEREYALNQYLRCKGLGVPRILHISPKRHLIFQEFVEGRTLAETIKSAVSDQGGTSEELELVKEAGRQIAKVHQLGVGLGDCKPENIIVAKDGKLYFIDLEQSSRDGDQPWDIAEFLYYSGHYVPPLANTDKIERVTKAFLEGYLEAGGSEAAVSRAASPRCAKVFSIFTQPHVMLAISGLCRKVTSK
jgi:tRNA A-37 threonylcarbamoyl transferase component Bud32